MSYIDTHRSMALLQADLRCGPWTIAMHDIDRCQSIITDPPYSARTHEGYRTGADINKMNIIKYDSLTFALASRFARHWAPRVTDWVVLFCDHVAWNWWDEAWSKVDFYTFQPVPWIKVDAAPRLRGDGPASAVEYLFIARPRLLKENGMNVRRPGSRPGYYLVHVDKDPRADRIVGQKRVNDVQKLVLDYSEPNDLVVDPFAGSCSVGVACVTNNRAYIGSEIDPETWKIGNRKLGLAPLPLPFSEPSFVKNMQLLEDPTLPITKLNEDK